MLRTELFLKRSMAFAVNIGSSCRVLVVSFNDQILPGKTEHIYATRNVKNETTPALMLYEEHCQVNLSSLRAEEKRRPSSVLHLRPSDCKQSDAKG